MDMTMMIRVGAGVLAVLILGIIVYRRRQGILAPVARVTMRQN